MAGGWDWSNNKKQNGLQQSTIQRFGLSNFTKIIMKLYIFLVGPSVMLLLISMTCLECIYLSCNNSNNALWWYKVNRQVHSLLLSVTQFNSFWQFKNDDGQFIFNKGFQTRRSKRKWWGERAEKDDFFVHDFFDCTCLAKKGGHYYKTRSSDTVRASKITAKVKVRLFLFSAIQTAKVNEFICNSHKHASKQVIKNFVKRE